MTQRFQVSPLFDVEVFLAACRSAGVLLSKLDAGEQAHGYITLANLTLEVNLYLSNQAHMDIVTGCVEEQA